MLCMSQQCVSPPYDQQSLSDVDVNFSHPDLTAAALGQYLQERHHDMSGLVLKAHGMAHQENKDHQRTVRRLAMNLESGLAPCLRRSASMPKWTGPS